MATCPHCNEVFGLSPRVLDRETVSMHMTWEGDMIEAKTVGGMIENTRKLLASVAKESGARKVFIGLAGIEWGEREATVHFVISTALSPPREDA